MDESSVAVIEVNQLVKRFDNFNAVDNISFKIKQGRCFGLLGPNGAGKTTTIEIIEGILQPSDGDVLYHGEPINHDFSQHIGIQFQHTALQDFLTVKETLSLFSSFYQQSLPHETLIELCDLDDFLDRDNRLLSGGQRQRLLLALALINDPDIIFLDEPTTGLDPQARRNFWNLIENIKKRNKTVVLTTHYMDEAERLCDDVVIMDKGKVIESGTPRELLSRHFDQVFVSLPKEQVDEKLLADMHWQQNAEMIEIGTSSIEQCLSTLMQRGVSLESLHVKSANLDDLFLKLTGHSLRD